jgi:drug/metabolite transporter (DMT)-like permease
LLPNKPLGVTVAKWYTIYLSRADRLKEEIGWPKVAFGIAVALDASVVAWLAQNYATASPIIVGAGFIAVLGFAVMIVLINRWAYRRIEELENV